MVIKKKQAFSLALSSGQTDLISDLTVYGQGSAMEIHLYIYLQFKGQEQSNSRTNIYPECSRWWYLYRNRSIERSRAVTDSSTMIARGL